MKKLKDQVEKQFCINIRELKRKKMLVHNTSITMDMIRNYRRIKTINIKRNEQGITWWHGSPDNQNHGSNQINITFTPCHFGGRRPWFICPKCNERAGVLYYLQDEFSCRVCCKLNYLCQQAIPLDWKLKRSDRLRTKLGMKKMFPAALSYSKPKHMRRITFIEGLGKLLLLEREILVHMEL